MIVVPTETLFNPYSLCFTWTCLIKAPPKQWLDDGLTALSLYASRSDTLASRRLQSSRSKCLSENVPNSLCHCPSAPLDTDHGTHSCCSRIPLDDGVHKVLLGSVEQIKRCSWFSMRTDILFHEVPPGCRWGSFRQGFAAIHATILQLTRTQMPPPGNYFCVLRTRALTEGCTLEGSSILN